MKKKRLPPKKAAKGKKLQILDDRGRPAPQVKAVEVGRRTGRVLKLADRRGSVVITRDGEDVAVMLSLAEFWRLLFEFAVRSPVLLRAPKRKKRKARKRSER